MKEPVSSQWINAREAAPHLAVPVREIYRLIDDGRLAAYKFGNDIRLKETDVRSFGETGPSA